jgi:hypothetical protein
MQESQKDVGIIDPHDVKGSPEKDPAPPTMADLLKVDDPQEQYEIVEKFLASKPHALTISMNPVTGNMNILANRTLTFKAMHAMLNMAADALHDQEKEALLQNQARSMMEKQANEMKDKQPEASEEAEENNEVDV